MPLLNSPWVVTLVTVLLAILQPSAALNINTAVELRAALLSGVTSLSLVQPIRVSHTDWPDTVLITQPVTVSSPYRVVLDVCDDACNNGSQPLYPLINVTTGGSLLVVRVFMRTFLPMSATDVTAYGPVPAILSSGGTVTFKLVVFHFQRNMLWVFAKNSFWADEKGGLSDVNTGTQLQLVRPALYAVKTTRKDYLIDASFGVVDLDGCYVGGPDDTTLVYCPYTLADALRNPYINKVRVFHDIGLDRLVYNYMNPCVVNRTVNIASCPGTQRSINLDDVLNGVVVATGGSVRLRNLVFKGTRATNYTDWPPNNAMLLSLFSVQGNGNVQLFDSTIQVPNVPALNRQLSTLPGCCTPDPNRPDLQPDISDGASDNGFTVKTWDLPMAKWQQFVNPNTVANPMGNPPAAFWDFENIDVTTHNTAYCFEAAVEQGAVMPARIAIVQNDDDLRAALVGGNSRYIQIVNDIKLNPLKWPSGSGSLLVGPSGIVEVRGCHPVPGNRYTIDLNNLLGVVRSSGRLIFQGDLKFINLGWGAQNPETLVIMGAFTAVAGQTGDKGTVELEGVYLESRLPDLPNFNSTTIPQALHLTQLSSQAKAMNVTCQGNEVFFGIYPLSTDWQVGTWSFMQTHLIWQSARPMSHNSTPVAAIAVPTAVGGVLLLAAVLFLTRKRLRKVLAGGKSPSSSEAGCDKLGSKGFKDLEALKHLDGHKVSSANISAQGLADAHGSTAASCQSGSHTHRSRNCPNEDINAARRDMVAARAKNTDDEITLTAVIGEGSYGRVYRGYWKGTVVAVKVIVLPSHMTGREKREKMAIMEAAISSSLSHPNIVQTYTYSVQAVTGKHATGPNLAGASLSLKDSTISVGAVTSSTEVSEVHSWEVRLVQEFCDQDSLRSKLSERAFFKGEALLLDAVLDSAIDIARAMTHLHRENIIHSDLKPRNVLLKGSNIDAKGFIAKVADFGLSMRIDPHATHISNAFQGTVTHMAPETLMHGHLSKASDVYAFGIMLWELYTGGQAYKGIPKALLGHNITKENMRPEFPMNAPFEYQLLACRCWETNPEIRPEFSFILDELKRMKVRLCGGENSGRLGTNVRDSSQERWGLPMVGPEVGIRTSLSLDGSSGSSDILAYHHRALQQVTSQTYEHAVAAGHIQLVDVSIHGASISHPH